VWTGEYVHALDQKGRVQVPKAFQEGLGGAVDGSQRCVVTRGFETCLALYSVDGWHAAVERFRLRAFDGPEARVMQRLLLPFTHELTLDSAGRVLLPPKLRSFAGLEGKVVFAGLVDRVELWSPESWDAFESEHAGQFDRLDTVLIGDGGARPEAEGPRPERGGPS